MKEKGLEVFNIVSSGNPDLYAKVSNTSAKTFIQSDYLTSYISTEWEALQRLRSEKDGLMATS